MIFRAIKRGDIWIVDFSPASGREQQGARPAIVMSSDLMDSGILGLEFVIPGTSTERTDSRGRLVPNHFRVDPAAGNGLRNVTFFMGEQLRSVSVERFEKRIGVLTAEQLYELEQIIIMLLDLGAK